MNRVDVDLDVAGREGVPTDVQAGPAGLTAEKTRLPETDEYLPPLHVLRGGLDALVSDGFVVESVCAVLTASGCQVATMTCRS